MNHKEAFILIVICACIVFFERSLPWIVFGKKEMPKIVKRLSDLLPASLMVILVVYSLRSLTTSDFHDSFAYHFIKCILKRWCRSASSFHIVNSSCIKTILLWFFFGWIT